jgi:hypothetical protein
MVSLLATLRPLEEQILKLINEKQPILDKVAELRIVMQAECVHPFEYLVHKDSFIECKFCNKRMNLS